MALVGLAIDVLLPGLAVMGADLGVEEANRHQYVISSLLFGMSIGQLIYGPIADSLGRKPSILVGLALFGVGCMVSALAADLRTMLIGRFLQGLGAAAPRIVTIALVRDQYSGTDMARIMSLVVAVLMVGPLVAPFVGQGILLFAGWRVIFTALLGFDLVLLLWLTRRQPETLPAALRIPMNWGSFSPAIREVLHSRMAVGYAVAGGIVFGELFAYVNSARQIYQDQYGLGVWFPVCFSLSGVAIATASLLNARLVQRIGMRRLCSRAGLAKVFLGAIFLAVSRAFEGTPPLAFVLTLVAAFFFCSGILFGNLNSRAMEPLGHVAGVAAGMVGSLTWFLAMLLATVVGQQFDGTVAPLATGFLTLSMALLAAMRWAEVDHGIVGR